jgi:chromosome segregation ATPase
MKDSVLLQIQIDEMKAAHLEEKHALQARIINLEEKVAGKVVEQMREARGEPALSAEQRKALEDRIKELTSDLKAAEKELAAATKKVGQLEAKLKKSKKG